MQSRWGVLAVLFVTRVCLAFQFQAVAAVSPVLRAEQGLSLADMGLLLGMYMLPGIVLPLAGGAVGHFLGDRRAVAAGFALTLLGAVLPILVPGWEALVTGRLLAGAGGIMVSVIMTKMVADWFDHAELATAMAIFVNSWLAGIMIALIVLPSVATGWGARAAFALAAVAVVFGMVLFLACYRGAEAAEEAKRPRVSISRELVLALAGAGLIWAIYNVTMAMMFSFGVALLVEHGYAVGVAGAAVSMALVLSIVSVPLGGLLADRFDISGTVLTVGSLALALLLAVAGRTGHGVAVFALIGLVGGIPAGVIMKLPARVMRPEQRAIGMGILYTISYAGFVVGTAVAGRLAGVTGTAQTTFDLAALLVALCPFLLLTVGHRPAAAAASKG